MSRAKPGYSFDGGPGVRSSLRRLKQLCCGQLADPSDDAVLAIARSLVAARLTTHPEYFSLVRVNQAREIAKKSGYSWVFVLNELTDAAERTIAETTTPEVQAQSSVV